MYRYKIIWDDGCGMKGMIVEASDIGMAISNHQYQCGNPQSIVKVVRLSEAPIDSIDDTCSHMFDA